jgi:3'(2'), 5'-bisphosphate nucleotidase
MYDQERLHAMHIVEEACALASRVQQRIVATGDAVQKADRSPVTIADLAIQAVISHRLRQLYPSDPLLGEEDASPLDADPDVAREVLELARSADDSFTGDSVRRSLDRGDHGGAATRYWVLDPVDGTKGFLRGDQYAVALSLIHDGSVAVGVLGCPNLGLQYPSGNPGAGTVLSAARGAGAAMRTIGGGDQMAVAVDRIDDPSSARFCESVEAAHAAHSHQARIAAALGITREPVRIDSQCKYAIVARGDASIYLRLPRDPSYREKVWDHAAGALVIEEAGGRVSDLEGRPLDVSQGQYLARSRGIVATNGHLHDRVLSACRQVLELD